MLKIGAFTYQSGKTPDGYVCGICGASRVRLYREYQTFLDNQKLCCTACAIDGYNKEHTQPWEPEGKNHAVGPTVAAVPTEDGSTFWGFSSVPDEGVKWWESLPIKISEPPKSNGEDEAEAYFSALDYAYDIYKSSTPEKISELPVAKVISNHLGFKKYG